MLREQRRHRISYLVRNIDFATFEDEIVWERLEPRRLAHGDVAMLLGMRKFAAREAVALCRYRAGRRPPLEAAVDVSVASHINANTMARESQFGWNV